MNKKFVILGIALTAIMIAIIGFNVSLVLQAEEKYSDLNLDNISALSTSEQHIPTAQELADIANSASGLLWEKYWVGCMVSCSYTVSTASGGFAAGAVITNYEVYLQAAAQNVQFSESREQVGLKSYCFDGWSFCSSDNCR
ncbi:MAG: hypothetical protein LBD59_03655 [Prevotellaceae bacterium]|jgi:hypothetical protein|nr:hypothetical protein [Prevotellaceae bacterium]